jgi:hypothetical protein
MISCCAPTLPLIGYRGDDFVLVMYRLGIDWHKVEPKEINHRMKTNS